MTARRWLLTALALAVAVGVALPFIVKGPTPRPQRTAARSTTTTRPRATTPPAALPAARATTTTSAVPVAPTSTVSAVPLPTSPSPAAAAPPASTAPTAVTTTTVDPAAIACTGTYRVTGDRVTATVHLPEVESGEVTFALTRTGAVRQWTAAAGQTTYMVSMTLPASMSVKGVSAGPFTSAPCELAAA